MNYFSAISPRIRPRTAAHRSRRELRHHRTRPEHTAVRHDVVAEDLGEDPPVLQPPI